MNLHYDYYYRSEGATAAGDRTNSDPVLKHETLLDGKKDALNIYVVEPRASMRSVVQAEKLEFRSFFVFVFLFGTFFSQFLLLGGGHGRCR